MPAAPLPADEARRLADLHALHLLDAEQDPVFDAVTRLCRSLFGSPIALVSLVDEHRQWFASRVGLEVRETPRDVAFCAHAILDDDVLVAEDPAGDVRFADNPLVTGAPGIRFYAGAPVQSPTGSRLGTLCLIDTEPRSFSADDRANLTDLALIVNRAIEQHASTMTDGLTGLYNRRGFVRAVEHAVALSRRSGLSLSLAYADIDGLKALNDSQGHAAGDAAIQAVADALSNAFRAADVVGRLGGDEFGVLFLDTPAAEAAHALARVTDLVDHHLDTPVGLSVANVEIDRDDTAESLMDRADRAMYQAKEARRRTS